MKRLLPKLDCQYGSRGYRLVIWLDGQRKASFLKLKQSFTMNLVTASKRSSSVGHVDAFQSFVQSFVCCTLDLRHRLALKNLINILVDIHTNGQMDGLRMDEVPHLLSFRQVVGFCLLIESHTNAQIPQVGQGENDDDQVQVEQSHLHLSPFHRRPGKFLGQFGGGRCELIEEETDDREEQADDLKPKVECT